MSLSTRAISLSTLTKSGQEPHCGSERGVICNDREPKEPLVCKPKPFPLQVATITDKLKSYGVAKREILPGVEHRQSRYLNNRCENSHRPTRQREYRMQGFQSAGHAQRFLAAYGPIAQHFRPRRHRLSAAEYRDEMRQRFESWDEMTGTERAA
jgi:DDE domain